MKSYGNCAFFLAVLSGVCIFLATLVASGPASAQITRTARVELTDSSDRVYFGENIYITKDPEKRLSADVVGMRHEQNLRGVRQEGNILNFGLAPPPLWLVFSVTNTSSTEDWVLDFGSLTDGRMGMAREISVTNLTTSTTLIKTLRGDVKQNSSNLLRGATLPVKIPRDKTGLFVVYLEMEGRLPATLAPSFVTARSFMSPANGGNILTPLMKIFLVSCVGGFLAFFYLLKDRSYLLMALYFGLHVLAYYFIDGTFFASLALEGEIFSTLVLVIILCSLFLTKFFFALLAQDYIENVILFAMICLAVISAGLGLLLPSQASVFDDVLVYIPFFISSLAIGAVSFYQNQKGKNSGLFWAAAWLVPAAGFFVSLMSCTGYFMPSAIGINAYWLTLLPQAFLFAAAGARKSQAQQVEERHMQARESRAAQSLTRLKQSKESADQARLLRVIERERELMTELREREIQRTDEMRRAKEQADHANQAKSAFLAVVSHEIRTPMNGIMGILRLLKDTKLSKEQGEYLLAIQKSGDTMMVLLNDILDFEKIETGNMELERIDFDLPKLVQGVVTLMSGHAATKGLTLHHDITEEVPRYVSGDPTRLRQVFLNLVNNALKFTETGGVTIRLRAKKPDGGKGLQGNEYEIYCAVEDTGIGISEEAQEKLFNPFEQADAGIARKYGGTGLGLAICQRLIEAMGSSIRLTSIPGVGSTFFFVLMMAQGRQENAEEPETTPGRIQRQSGPQMNILVVEDNEINRKVLQSFLEKENCKVTLSDSGESAASLCESNNFDAVLLDINLGGMSGYEAAQQIRLLPSKKKSSVPIIAITGNVSRGDVNKIFESGMNDYIPKPIDFEKLMRILRDVQEGKYPSNEPAREFKIERPRPEKKSPAEGDETLLSHYVMQAGDDLDDDFDSFEDIGSLSDGDDLPEPPAEDEAVEPPQNDPNLDQKMMATLLDSLGKLQLTELMHGFMLKADEIVGILQEEISNKNLAAIKDRAHDLKGMAANFGVKILNDKAKIIEDAAKKSDLGAALEEIRTLPEANSAARASITAWLKR